MANIYLENLKDATTALIHARKAYDLKPTNYNVIDTYAWALFKTGDVKGAQEYLFASIKIKEVGFNTLHLAETLVEKDPNASWRWLKRAKAHVKNEKTTSLLADIQRLEGLLK